MRYLFSLACFFLTFTVYASFGDYFYEKSLRFDYYRTGNETEDIVSFDEMLEEPFWGGSKTNLIDTFSYGEYFLKLTDIKSGNLIYSRGYSSLFNEWQTTAEAKITRRSFSESVVFPFPKNKTKLELFRRNCDNQWEKQFEYLIDPNNSFIIKEKRLEYPTIKVHYSGDPSIKMDIVFIPDGYTASEMNKFRKDCQLFKDYLLKCRPYNEVKNKINIWVVKVPSKESGTDIPGENIWKNTVVNSNFYTFDSERYLTTSDNKTLRSLAANAPYDQIVLLVNSEKYGGGGIYNQFSVTSTGNSYSNFVFIHEFGHAFAGLGDEYYTSDVAYEGFYNLKVEPWEPNLTTLVNFDVKWKNMLQKDIPIPTPNTDAYKETLGVFEGGGYMAKGVYRPVLDCSMKSTIYDGFCPVCRHAIVKMIDFYSK